MSTASRACARGFGASALVLLLALAAWLPGQPAGAQSGPPPQIQTRVDPYVIQPPALDFAPSLYRISARLDASAKTISGSESVEVANNSPTPWSEVWFHLYPNAFATKEGAPTFVSLDREYPHGFNPAWLRVETDVDAQVVADAKGKETLLRYPLAEPLQPGARATLSLRFIAQIPEAQSRFSYWDDVYALGQWYPTVAAYDAGGWHRDPYYAIGDPFYTPVSRYELTLQVPKGFVVGSTGVVQSKDDGDPAWDIYAITTGLVRDFAIATSPRYREVTREANGVTIRSLYADEANRAGGEATADTAREAMLLYDRAFGSYPYRAFTAAQTYFPGGMEYPNLVYVGAGLYNQPSIERHILDLIVAHEVAHQWWYGLVGNDEIAEPWLDEGIAEFSTYYYLQSQGLGSAPRIDPQYDDTGLFYRSVPSYGDDDRAYNHQIYDHGAEGLFKLRAAIGDDLFDRVMQTFFQRWQYRVAHVDDFVQVVREVAGEPGLDAIAIYIQRQP